MCDAPNKHESGQRDSNIRVSGGSVNPGTPIDASVKRLPAEIEFSSLRGTSA